MNYQKFLNKIASRRTPSVLRTLIPMTKIPGMISLAGGLPNGSTFPFESCSFKLKDGSHIEISGASLATALQYGPTEGIADMYKWVMEHQQRKHKPKLDNWNICVTTGSQDALSKTFEMLINEGDPVLVENPTYSGALASLKPLKPELIEVQIDGLGIVPEHLQQVLESRLANHLPVPKFLYTIPVGQNPSGATLSVERKQKIYKLAQQYDFLILEDDPYFYLTLDHEARESAAHSFFSMDTDGRVMRFDSLSKVLSSGLRIGWATGPQLLIQYLNYHMQATELHASAISQVIAAALLNKWGEEGLQQHVKMIQEFYKQRRDTFVALVDKHLTGYVEYSKPSAGMFLWMKLKGIDDSKSLIEQKARDKLVLLVPGQAFQPNDKPTNTVRASFSIESEENMDVGLSRLAALLKDYAKSKQ